MKKQLIQQISLIMNPHLNPSQTLLLENTMLQIFTDFGIPDDTVSTPEDTYQSNIQLISQFLAAKRIEGCSDNTLKYYSNTLHGMIHTIQKDICTMDTNDLRCYLADYQTTRNSSKVTLDNIRRIMSTFFTWLEDEDFISKSPVRRIRKVKTSKIVKETLSDENLEQLRDRCAHPRDLAIIDLLSSTGIRVGELVKLNRSDINFHERECVVLGKGDNPALFVTLNAPWNRLSISGVEHFLRKLGASSDVNHVHPHKFRRTMATMALEKGMPIEQVQRLLGHAKIDTTLQYAIVNQSNVKIAHRKYMS